MTTCSPHPSAIRHSLPIERLQDLWHEVNVRYFAAALPPIEIVWSRRLTASTGMFVSRVGPRDRTRQATGIRCERRLIRLSLPLLQSLSKRTPYAEQEIANTLAHEMIHQWQFDVLKRRPNHGTDFLRKMTEMNRDGRLGITIYHSLGKEVHALASYAWRCRQCGRVYRRQRRTIEPRRHHCGACRGSLQELLVLRNSRRLHHDKPSEPSLRPPRPQGMAQLPLPFALA